MRSLMVVIPDEVLDGSAPRPEREERPDVEAFIIDRTKEPLDFAVRLRCIRPQQIVTDAQRGAHVFESASADHDGARGAS